MSVQDPMAVLQAALPSAFQVDGYVDRGGQGLIFKGSFLGSPAAIKVFLPQTNPDRLARELDLLGHIKCDSLVVLLGHDIVTFQGATCSVVAYEFHSGGDLRRLLDDTLPPVDLPTLLSIGAAIGEAIEVLWSHRIVHRDIKPANVVRAANGRFVVVDVGLARHVDRSDLTRPGGAPGTEGYKSPEQAVGRKALTIHSDVFAAGITIHELAARAHPFGRQQSNIGVRAPPDLSAARQDLPSAFCALIRQAMSIRPADRPRELRARIGAIQGA